MAPSRWLAAFLFGLGLIFAQFAFSGWTIGDPAPVSLFAQRETVRVASVEILSGRTNGAIRHTPRVTVFRGAEIMELAGLTGSFYDNRQVSAEAAIEGYVIGQLVTVRLVNAVPYADRTDWFSLIGSIVVSLFAVALIAAGGVLAFAGNAGQTGRITADRKRDDICG
jgi:hypothetical protein